MTAALEGGEWSAARPGRTLPPGKTRYPLYRRLGGPQGRSGRAENLFPTGIRSRTVQLVAQSLYRLSYPGSTTSSNHKKKQPYWTRNTYYGKYQCKSAKRLTWEIKLYIVSTEYLLPYERLYFWRNSPSGPGLPHSRGF